MLQPTPFELTFASILRQRHASGICGSSAIDHLDLVQYQISLLFAFSFRLHQSTSTCERLISSHVTLSDQATVVGCLAACKSKRNIEWILLRRERNSSITSILSVRYYRSPAGVYLDFSKGALLRILRLNSCSVRRILENLALREHGKSVLGYVWPRLLGNLTWIHSCLHPT
jgi:hypothetical protein